MKNCIIVIIAKFITFILKLLGKNAGTVPGRIALKLNKNIRDYIKIDGKLIVITGTNGKTTTTNMIYEILRKSNKKVVCNIGGNNIGWGITTTLLKSCNIFGKIKADYIVLETDEHWIPVLYTNANLKIDTLIILNLFNDQLDRTGEVDTIISKIGKILKNYKGNLILNGNDPNVVRLGLMNTKGKNYYYGSKKLKTSYTDSTESIICPICKETLEYEFYQYSHIGKFICPKCEFGKINYYNELSKIDVNDFYIGKDKYTTNNPNLYNIYNLLAIITLSNIYNLDKDIVNDIFTNYASKDGRYQKFNINNKECILNLGKNPTGFNVILNNIKKDKDNKELLILINDKINDGKDVSWIWGIDFNNMNSFNRIICSGTRAYDIAITLKCNNYDKNKIIVEHDIDKSINKLLETDSKKYIISNYSPLTKTKEILEQLEKGDK
ncbi:MAG: DUF1727 domain-containing protein [Firmicutes bacterium]|nr:DUF1727 domain-containing protein [Bacillota bacterium]